MLTVPALAVFFKMTILFLLIVIFSGFVDVVVGVVDAVGPTQRRSSHDVVFFLFYILVRKE